MTGHANERRHPVSTGGRILRRLVWTMAKVAGLPRRLDHGWPRFEGGPGKPGDQDARDIVLVHGFGVDGGTMLQLGRLLVGRHHVVIPDLPGFGEHAPRKSFPGGSGPGIEPFLESIDDLLDRMGIERPILVGCSMGGAIVANYAATRMDRPSGIVLIGPAGIEPPVDSEVFAAAKRDEHMLRVDDRASFDRIYELNFVKPPFMPGWMRKAIAKEAAPRADEYESVLRSLEPVMLGGPDPYRSIRCPTEIVWGAQDRIIDPSAAPVWNEAIRDSRVTMIPQAGHSTMVERPAEVAAVVERLIDRQRG
ncbi:MAG: alpha/beta hydrolase [Phycisphaera sp.]|nr:alpha/beta hydrolase [Phycisphaera sp.]